MLDNIFEGLELPEATTESVSDNGIDYSQLFDLSTEDNILAAQASKKLLQSVGQEKEILDAPTIQAVGENVNKIISESPTAVAVDFTDDDDDAVVSALMTSNTELGEDPTEVVSKRKKAKKEYTNRVVQKAAYKPASDFEKLVATNKTVQDMLMETQLQGNRWSPTSSMSKYNIDKGFGEPSRGDVDPSFNYSTFDKLNRARSYDETAWLTRGFIGPDGKAHGLEDLVGNNIYIDEGGGEHMLVTADDENSPTGWVVKTKRIEEDIKPTEILSIYNGQKFAEEGLGDYLGHKLINGISSASLRTLGSIIESLGAEEAGLKMQNRWYAESNNKESILDSERPLHTGDGFFDYDAKKLLGSMAESTGAMLPGIAAGWLSGSVIAGAVVGGLTMGDQINQEMRELGIKDYSRKGAFWATVAMGTLTEYGIGQVFKGGASAYAKNLKGADAVKGFRAKLAAFAGLSKAEQKNVAQEALDSLMRDDSLLSLAADEAEQRIIKTINEQGYKAALKQFPKEQVETVANKIWEKKGAGALGVAIEKALNRYEHSYLGSAAKKASDAMDNYLISRALRNAHVEGQQEVVQYLGDILIKNVSDAMNDPEWTPKFNQDLDMHEAVDNYVLGGLSGFGYGLLLNKEEKRDAAKNKNMAEVIEQYLIQAEGKTDVAYQNLMNDLDNGYNASFFKEELQRNISSFDEQGKEIVQAKIDQAEKLKQDFSVAFQTYLSIHNSLAANDKNYKREDLIQGTEKRLGGSTPFLKDYVAAKLSLEQAIKEDNQPAIDKWTAYFENIDNGNYRSATFALNAIKDIDAHKIENDEYRKGDTLRDWYREDRGYLTLSNDMKKINAVPIPETILTKNITMINKDDIDDPNTLTNNDKHELPFLPIENYKRLSQEIEAKEANGQTVEQKDYDELDRLGKIVEAYEEYHDKADWLKSDNPATVQGYEDDFNKANDTAYQDAKAAEFDKYYDEILNDTTMSASEKAQAIKYLIENGIDDPNPPPPSSDPDDVYEPSYLFNLEMYDVKAYQRALERLRQDFVDNPTFGVQMDEALLENAYRGKWELMTDNRYSYGSVEGFNKSIESKVLDLMTEQEKEEQSTHIVQSMLLKPLATMSYGSDKDLITQLSNTLSEMKNNNVDISKELKDKLLETKKAAERLQRAQEMNLEVETTNTLVPNDKQTVKQKINKENTNNNLEQNRTNVQNLKLVNSLLEQILGAKDLDERKAQLIKYRKMYLKEMANAFNNLLLANSVAQTEMMAIINEVDKINDTNAADFYNAFYDIVLKAQAEVNGKEAEVLENFRANLRTPKSASLNHDSFRTFGKSQMLDYVIEEDLDMDNEFMVQAMTLLFGLRPDTVAQVKETTHSNFELDKAFEQGGISIEQINTLIAETAAINLLGTDIGDKLVNAQNMSSIDYALLFADLSNPDVVTAIETFIKDIEAVKQLQAFEMPGIPSDAYVHDLESFDNSAKQKDFVGDLKAKKLDSQLTEIVNGISAYLNQIGIPYKNDDLYYSFLEIRKASIQSEASNSNILSLIGNAGTGKTMIMMNASLRHQMNFNGPLNNRKIYYIAPSAKLAEKAKADFEKMKQEGFKVEFEVIVADDKKKVIDKLTNAEDDALVIVDEFTLLDYDFASAISDQIIRDRKALFLGDVNQVDANTFNKYGDRTKRTIAQIVSEQGNYVTINDFGFSLINLSQSFRAGLRSLTILGSYLRNEIPLTGMESHVGKRTVSAPSGVTDIVDSKGIKAVTNDLDLVNEIVSHIEMAVSSNGFYSLEDIMIIIPSAKGVMNKVSGNTITQNTDFNAIDLPEALGKFIYERLSDSAKKEISEEQIIKRVFHFDVNNKGLGGGIAQGLGAKKVFGFVTATYSPQFQGQTTEGLLYAGGKQEQLDLQRHAKSFALTMATRMEHESQNEQGSIIENERKYGYMVLGISQERQTKETPRNVTLSLSPNRIEKNFDDVAENKRKVPDAADMGKKIGEYKTNTVPANQNTQSNQNKGKAKNKKAATKKPKPQKVSKLFKNKKGQWVAKNGKKNVVIKEIVNDELNGIPANLISAIFTNGSYTLVTVDENGKIDPIGNVQQGDLNYKTEEQEQEIYNQMIEDNSEDYKDNNTAIKDLTKSNRASEDKANFHFPYFSIQGKNETETIAALLNIFSGEFEFEVIKRNSDGSFEFKVSRNGIVATATMSNEDLYEQFSKYAIGEPITVDPKDDVVFLSSYQVNNPYGENNKTTIFLSEYKKQFPEKTKFEYAQFKHKGKNFLEVIVTLPNGLVFRNLIQNRERKNIPTVYFPGKSLSGLNPNNEEVYNFFRHLYKYNSKNSVFVKGETEADGFFNVSIKNSDGSLLSIGRYNPDSKRFNLKIETNTLGTIFNILNETNLMFPLRKANMITADKFTVLSTDVENLANIEIANEIVYGEKDRVRVSIVRGFMRFDNIEPNAPTVKPAIEVINEKTEQIETAPIEAPIIITENAEILNDDDAWNDDVFNEEIPEPAKQRNLSNYIPFRFFDNLLKRIVGPALNDLFGANAFDSNLHKEGLYGKVENGAIVLDTIERDGDLQTHGTTPLHELVHFFVKSLNKEAYERFYMAAANKFGIPYNGGKPSKALIERVAQEGALYLSRGTLKTVVKQDKDGYPRIEVIGKASALERLWYGLLDTLSRLLSVFKNSSFYENEMYAMKYGFRSQQLTEQYYVGNIEGNPETNETLYEEIEENEVEEDLSQVAEIIKGFNDNGIHFDRAVAFVRDTIFQSFRYHPMYMGYAYKPIGDMIGNMAMTRLVAALKKVFSSNELVAVNGKLSLSIEKRSLVMGETLIPIVRDEKTMDFILKNINLRTITVDGEIEVHSVFDIQQDSDKVMRLHPEDIDAYLNFVIGTNTELIMNVAGQALGGVSVEKLKSERNLGKSNFKDNDARSDSSISVAERYGKLPELFLSTIRDISGTKRVNTIAVKDLLIRIAQALPLNYGGRSSIEVVFETMSKHYGFFFKGQKLNESISKEDLLDIARTLYGLDAIDKKTFEAIKKPGFKDYNLLNNAIEAINNDPTWESFRLTYDTMFNPNALTHYGLAKHLLPLFEGMQYYALQMTTQEGYEANKESFDREYRNLKATFEKLVNETSNTRIDFISGNQTEADKLIKGFRGMIISLDLAQKFGINPALDTDLKAFEFRAKRIKEFIESIENQRSMVTTVVSATQSGKRTGLINSYIRGLADRAERLSTNLSVIFSGKQGHTVNTIRESFSNRFSISKLNSFPKEHERLMEALTLNNSGNSNFSWEFDTFKEGEHKGKAQTITIKAGEKGKPKSFVLLKITYDLTNKNNPVTVSAGPELRDGSNTYQSRMRSLGKLLFNNVSFKKAFNEQGSKAEELIGLTVLQHIMALEFAHGTMKEAELLFSLFKNATYGSNTDQTPIFSFTTVGYNKVPTGVHPSYIAGAVTNIFQNSRVTLTQKNRSATNKTILDLTRRNNSFFNNIEDALNSFDKVWQSALKKTTFFGQRPLQLLEMYIDGGVKATGAIDKRVMQANDMQTHHLLLFIERLKSQQVICVPEMPQSVRKDAKLVEVKEDGGIMFGVREDKGGISVSIDYENVYDRVLETLEAYDAISRISLDNLLTVLTKALNEKNGTALVYRPNKERATADLRNDAKNLFEQLKRVWKDVTQEDLYALGLNPEDAKIYRSEKTKEVYMELGRDADYKFLANDKVITKENLQLLREKVKEDSKEKERIIDNMFAPHYKAMAENKSSTYDKVIEGNYPNHQLNSYAYTKGGKEYKYDDLMVAQALAYFIVNANLTPFIMGSISGFKDSASLGKRAMAHSQPYSAIVPLNNGIKSFENINDRYTSNGAKVIVFKDSETKGFLFDPIFGNHSDFSIADYDGAIWINPILADHIYDGSGGSYGQADKNALLKLALSQANMPMKGLIMPITHESLLYSPMQRRMLKLMLNPGNSPYGQRNGVDVIDGIDEDVSGKIMNAYSYFEEKYAEYLAIGNSRKEAFNKAIKETGIYVATYNLDMADILSPDGSVKKDMRMASQESFQEMLVNEKPATNFMLPFNVNKTGVNTNFSSTPDSVEPDTTAFQQLLNILVGTNTDTKSSNAFLFDQAEQMEAARNSLIQTIFPEGDMAMLYRGMREGDPAIINRIITGLNAIAATSNDLGYMVNAGLTMATAEKATKTFQLANKRMQRIVKPNLAGLRTADRAFNEKEIVEVTFVSNGNEIKEVFVNQEYAQRFIATLPEAIRATAVVSPARMLNHSFPQLTEEGRERAIELISASGIYDQKTIDLLSAIYGNDGNAIAKFLEYPDRLVQEISDNEIAKEIAEKLLNAYGDICKKLYKIDGKRGKLMQYHVGESIGASVMAAKHHVPADMSMAELFYLVKKDSVESLSTASYKDEAINEHPWFKAFAGNEKLKADDNGRKKFLEAVRIVDMSRESVSVRTPSTNAHSGVMTKNIFFLHDSGMVTLYSPLDMFARGSDQDGDQSSHYHRLPEGIQIGKINADESNKYVDMAFDYYNNPNHFPYIFKPINTDAFVKEAKKSIPNDRYIPFNSATGSQLINSATAGAKGISIYAIFQKAFTFMLQAYNGDVATYFKEVGIYYNKPEQVAAALAFIGDVGNALVDNTKHGIAGTVNMFDEFIPAIMASFNDPNFMQRIQEAGLYQYKDGLSEYENRIKATVAFLTSPQFNEIANSRKSFYENGRKDTIELGEMALFKASNNTGKIDTVTDSYIIDNNTGLQLSKYVKKPEAKEETEDTSFDKVKTKGFNKKLAKQLKTILQELYPKIKLRIEENPTWATSANVFNQEEYANEVNYRLKAAEIVTNNIAKIKQWEANKSINEETLFKKIGELGVPKQQLELLKNSEGKNIEEKLLSFVNGFGYTVEINTAQEGSKNASTKYYSDLTVKGGTNYTENEIATPLITPSIKGHAQFATDKGIGWFRSDDRLINENTDKNIFSEPYKVGIGSIRMFSFATLDEATEWINKNPQFSLLTNLNLIKETKTKRILEVQSDLFQKGRDKKSLTKKQGEQRSIEFLEGENRGYQENVDNFDKAIEAVNTNNFKIVLPNNQGRYISSVEAEGVRAGTIPISENPYTKEAKEGNFDKEYALSYLKKERDKYQSFIYKNESIIKEINTSENQFLQLLNKDNNWVTFFIRAIIQDSTKKGYEKVLFPSGNTASKIEGHATLEEFKKQKEDRIKELETASILKNKTVDGFYYIQRYLEDENGNEVLTWRKVSNETGKEKTATTEEINELKERFSEETKNEIAQLKEELARVETEGFGALKPIYNFYENTVTNILNKQFGKENVKQITDEYGNTWNEISINQARDLADVMLQQDEAKRIIGQADIKAKTVLIDAINQKQDTLPHEYAHHYIAMFRDTEIVQEAIKQWGSEESLVQAIGEQAVKQKGKAWSWWNKFVNWILNNADVSALEKEDIKNILTDAFLTNQNLKAKSYDEIKQPLSLLQLSDKIYNDPTIAQNDKQKAFDEAINNDFDLQEEVDALMETVKDQFNNKNKKRLKREDTGLLLLNHVVAKLNAEKTASDLESGGLNAYQQTLMDQVQSFTNSYATILSTIYKNKSEVKQKVEAVKKALEEAIIKKEPIDEAIKKFSLNRFTKAENAKKKKMLNNLFAGTGKQLKEAFNKYADANELTDEQRVELYFLMRTADLETIEDKLSIESDYVDNGIDDEDLDAIALMTAVKDKKEVDAFYSEVKKQIWKMKKTLSAMKSLSLRNSYGWNTINQMLLEYAINGKSIMNFATFANLNQFDFNSPFAMFRFKNEVKANHGMEYDDFAQLFLGTAEEGKAKLPPFNQRVQNMVEKPEPATFKYLKDGAEVEETLDFNSAVANKVDWIAFVLDHPSLFEMVKSFVMLEALSKARMEGSVAARETIEYVRTIQQAGGKKNLSEKDYIEITKVIQDYYYAKFLQSYIGENKEEVNALLNNGIIFENGRAMVNPISNGSPLLDNFDINLPIDLSTPQGIYLFVTNAPTYIYEVIQEYKANNSDNPAVIYNAFVQDLTIDQSGMRDKLVLNDVKEGSSEDAAYRIGMTNLPEPIKNLIKLYMLADGGLGYSKGFSRYMPIEFKMEADAFIKEMMASTDRNIAQEMIAYFEDRIAGSPESFLYENTKNAPNTANKVYLVKEKDANGKMNIESDLIYRNSNGQLMKLPFGNFAMTVIPGRANSVPISLENQRIGDNIPVEELLDKSHSFTFEGIAYESIADFFSHDYNSKIIKDNDALEDIARAMLRNNIDLIETLSNYISVAYKANKDVPRYYQQIANAINKVFNDGSIQDIKNKYKFSSEIEYANRKSLIFPVLNYEIIKKNFMASEDNMQVKLDNISKTQEMIYTPGSIVTFLDGTVGTVISAGKGSLTYEVTEKGELYDGASLNMSKMRKKATSTAMEANGLNHQIEAWIDLGRRMGMNIQTMTIQQALDAGYTIGSEISFYDASTDTVVLLTDRVTEDVAVHEMFGHALNAQIKKANPALWKEIIELAKQSPLWETIVNDPEYADLRNADGSIDEDAVADEVLSHAIQNAYNSVPGTKMDIPLYKSWVEKIKDFLRDLFYSVFPKDLVDALNLDGNTSIEDLSEQILNLSKTKKYKVKKSVFDIFTQRISNAAGMKRAVNHLNNIKDLSIKELSKLFVTSNSAISFEEQKQRIMDSMINRIKDSNNWVETMNSKGVVVKRITLFVGGATVTFSFDKIATLVNGKIELLQGKEKEIESMVNDAMKFDDEMRNNFYSFLNMLSTDGLSLFGAVKGNSSLLSRSELMKKITELYFGTYRSFLQKSYNIENGEISDDKEYLKELEDKLQSKVLEQVRTTLLHLDFDPMYDNIYIGKAAKSVLNVPEDMLEDVVIVEKQGKTKASYKPIIINRMTTKSLGRTIGTKGNLASFISPLENNRKRITKRDNVRDFLAIDTASLIAMHNHNSKAIDSDYKGLFVKSIKVVSLSREGGLQLNKKEIRPELSAALYSPSETMRQAMEIFNDESLSDKLSDEAKQILSPSNFVAENFSNPQMSALDELISITETLSSHIDQTEVEKLKISLEDFRKEYLEEWTGRTKSHVLLLAIQAMRNRLKAQYENSPEMAYLDSRIEVLNRLQLEILNREKQKNTTSESLLDETKRMFMTTEELSSPIARHFRLAMQSMQEWVGNKLRPKLAITEEITKRFTEYAGVKKVADTRLTRASSIQAFYKLHKKRMAAMNLKEVNSIATFEDFNTMLSVTSKTETLNDGSVLNIEVRRDKSGNIYEKVIRDYPNGTNRVYYRKEVLCGELHIDVNDPMTEQALTEGKITLEDIAYAKEYAQQMWEAAIEQVITSKELHKTKTDIEAREEAEAWLDAAGFKFGMLPHLKENTAESFFKESIENQDTGFFKKMWNTGAKVIKSYQREKENNLDADPINEAQEEFSSATSLYDDLRHSLDEQLMHRYYNQKGLRIDSLTGEMIITDEDIVAEQSVDLYTMANYSFFVAYQTRGAADIVNPVKDAVVDLMKSKAQQGMGDNYELWAETIEDLYNMLILKKRESLGTVDFGPWKRDITTLINMAKGMQSLSLFGFNFWQFPKSVWTNTGELYTMAKENESLGRTKMFQMKHLVAASKLLLTEQGQIKAKAINNIYGIVSGTPQHLIEDYENRPEMKVLFSEDMPMLPLRLPDIMQRYVLMVAQMMAMGTWDAHSIDSEGNVVYDETMDLQYYDENGNLSEDGLKLRNRRIMKRVDEGYQTETDKLTGAYDSTGVSFQRALANMKVGQGQRGQSLAVFQGKSWGALADTFMGSYLKGLKDTILGWEGDNIGSLDYSYIGEDGKLTQFDFTSQAIVEGIGHYVYEFQKLYKNGNKFTEAIFKAKENMPEEAKQVIAAFQSDVAAYTLYAAITLGVGFLLFDGDDEDELKKIQAGFQKSTASHQISLQARQKMMRVLEASLFESHYHVNPFATVTSMIEYPTTSLIYTKRLLDTWKYIATFGMQQTPGSYNKGLELNNLLPVNSSAWNFLSTTDYEEKVEERNAKMLETLAKKKQAELQEQE